MDESKDSVVSQDNPGTSEIEGIEEKRSHILGSKAEDFSQQSFSTNDNSSFEPSAESSPFISNPEVSELDTREIDLSPNKSSQQSMDNQPSPKHFSPDSSQNETHFNKNASYSFASESLVNDTAEQLEHDLNIDSDFKINNRNIRATNDTPWKNLRSSNLFSPVKSKVEDRLSQNYRPFSKDYSSGIPVSQEASSSSRIEDLERQITGYRIQIKFFKEFLQYLINKTEKSNGNSQIDINELTHFQNDLNFFSPSKHDGQKSTESKVNDDQDRNMDSYNELLKLNDDLYSSLEDFQGKLQNKEIALRHNLETSKECLDISRKIATTLLTKGIDDDVKQFLTKEINSQQDGNPDSVLNLLETINEVVVKSFNEQIKGGNSYPSPPPSHPKTEIDLTKYETELRELSTILDDLQNDFKAYKEDTAKIEDNFKKELESMSNVNDIYQEIYKKFDSLCVEMDSIKDSNYSKELNDLKDENRKLRLIRDKVNEQLEHYQVTIDELKREVGDFKKQDNIGSERSFDTLAASSLTNEDKLKDELIASQKEITRLYLELEDVNKQHHQLKEESSKVISNLNAQLRRTKENSRSQSFYKENIEQLKYDLSSAIEEQRMLKAEKIRLSYKVEALANDKLSLQETIQSLNDKIASSTTISSSIDNTRYDSSSIRLAKELHNSLYEVFAFDAKEFSKLFKSFTKIADDSSLTDPKRKIDLLGKKISEMRLPERDIESLDTASLMEMHRAVFQYFARAVDIIVNDHIKVLLKENGEDSQAKLYIQKLQERIEELSQHNDRLSQQLDEYENSSNSHSTDNAYSPRSKLRIIELSNRWKAEREARAYENKEFRKRINELMVENDRLRRQFELDE
ncbi:Piso0_004063 [Millerozyma farinosa CBS 7064]|uniref:Piso0_004063 protein n=1 Tax=Pichia sorbitophila (strain ATCC MYA-4447 / BCRC 22081 / CBS 7064 / NBRC 10061 / NRRL Y-12695) TaxID=559304 RepID=G8YAA4_PICSO|nr:Piso0_004063 [Millerozyma farinosa CBS 7064]CCE84518.1 Piso0_004063 [Millerozyma farinosa CBS 7064]